MLKKTRVQTSARKPEFNSKLSEKEALERKKIAEEFKSLFK